MTTVRDASFELFRERGMTTIFGNPGSTELPMLGPFPEDFRYVLGLQEAVAVGMADGFAQASGNVTHVNLHTAPGVGNGVGAIFNARANRAPLLVTAGQQARSLMTLQALLTNRDAARMPHPLVKWSYEPPRAADADAAVTAAFHLGQLAFDGAHAYADAHRWFTAYLAERPGGALASEALGRTMEAEQRLGDLAAARETARRYLARYPAGAHANLANSLVAP